MDLNEKQQAFFYLYLIYFAIVHLTADTFFLRPLKLLTTFIHEFSHALACWMTGGEVRGIEVYTNAGGVTKYRGGCRCIISSAGYLGEAFWGMVFVITSGGRKTSTVAAGGLILALLISLCYAPNKTMVILSLSYAIFTAVFIYLEYEVFSPILPYVTLFYGVVFQYMAVNDIFEHQVVRSHKDSDAYHLYMESGKCCPPRCIGTWWLILAILMEVSGLVVGIILMSDECENAGWFECVFHTKLDLDLDWLRFWD